MFNYSNEGYALLQSIVERASGKDFISYIESHIFKPLEMERSMFRISDLAARDNVTELYAYGEKEAFHSPVWWDVGEIYGNGSLKTTVGDLERYAEMYRRGGEISGQRIVSKESIRCMMMPHITLPNGRQYGYGLQVTQHNGVTFIGHGGGIKGVSSNIQIIPSAGYTAVILANIADAPAEDIIFSILEESLGIPAAAPLPVFEVPAEELQRYTGQYSSMEGQELWADVVDDELHIQQGNQDIPLRPYGDGRFISPAGKKFIFTCHPDGVVKAVFTGLRWIPKV